MKKAIISLGATVWLVLSCTKHAVPEYYYAVDLNQITNDELRVEMNFTGVLPDTGSEPYRHQLLANHWSQQTPCYILLSQ
jgi:hypothetical protein